jgi:iron complex outermembrane receptor protein
LQLLYAGENLNAIAGLYYFKETYEGSTNIGLTPTSGTFFTLLGDSDTEVWAPFFNFTYDINDKFSIRVGGRYNNETREITNDSVLNGVLITTDDDIADDKRDASKYTGEYGIDFHVSENNMLYYTFSQGFRSGAGLVFQSNSPIIDPTTVDNHEVGWKLQSSDGRLALSLAVFDAAIHDLQRTQASLNPNGTLNTRVNNIERMDTQGVELDLSWAATDRFRLTGAVAYLEAEFKDFLTDDPLEFGTEIVQVAGNTPNLAPDWKGNLHGEYDFSLNNNAVLTASGDISYIGEQFFDEFNREPFVEESYTLVDASLTYRPAADTWSVALWGKNLGDEKKLMDTNFSAFGGITNKFFIPPLTWGVSVSVNF